MSALWPDIVKIALLGTERQAADWPAAEGPLGQLLAQLDPSQREASLLSAAAAISLYQRTGSMPTLDAQAPSPPCAAEELPWCSPRAGGHLKALCRGEHAEVLPEWLAAAGARNKLALPETLPALLDLGRDKPELRAAVLPVLGQRGRWLAAQNPGWDYVAGDTDDESVWHTGSRAGRLTWWKRLRSQNPGRARELLASGWAKESPEERADFLRAFQIGLSPEDEPFLEMALDDRRKEVRQEAAGLLARLPGSAFIQRMTARVQPLLKFTAPQKGGLLRSARKAQLTVELPAQCDRTMQRDGIELKRQGIGEKAWWLMQMIGYLPPSFWNQTWQATPEDILAAAARCEWKNELREAWIQAAIRHRDATWAEHLLPVWIEEKAFQGENGLMEVLPPERREAFLFRLIAESKKSLFNHPQALSLLEECQHPWSERLTRMVLDQLRRGITRKEPLHWHRQLVKELARWMAPALAGEAATGWPNVAEHPELSSQTIDEMLALLHFRHDMLEALNVES